MNKQILIPQQKSSVISEHYDANIIKRNKERGAALPAVVISMVVISLFSLLILTFAMSSTLSSNLLIKNSANKLEYARIYNDFKNDSLEIDENSNTKTLIYSAYDLDDKTTISNENIKAIIVKRENTILLFGVYDFTPNFEKDIIFQTSKISIKLDKNNCFEFNGYYFIPDNLSD